LVLSEEVRQHAEVVRNYLIFIIRLVSDGSSGALLNEENQSAGRVDAILGSIIQGAATHPELEIAKNAFNCLARLVEVWVGTVPGFEAFVVEKMLPTVITAPTARYFALNDPKSLSVISEIAGWFKVVVGKPSTSGLVLNALKDHLSRLGIPPAQIDPFLLALQQQNAQALKATLKDFYEWLQQRNST